MLCYCRCFLFVLNLLYTILTKKGIKKASNLGVAHRGHFQQIELRPLSQSLAAAHDVGTGLKRSPNLRRRVNALKRLNQDTYRTVTLGIAERGGLGW